MSSKAVSAALRAAEQINMSPWNLWVNKSIAPKHLSQLQQLLEASFWNQTPHQEPGPGCECRKVCDTAQQRAKRRKKRAENPCNAGILQAQNQKEGRMAKKKQENKRAFPVYLQRWPKEILWRPAVKHKPLIPRGRTEMSILCSLGIIGWGKCKAGRKMVHKTWRLRGVHKLLLLPPYFFPEGPVPGKAFMEIRLCRQAHFSKIQQEISLSLQGGTETHTLNQDQSLG